MTQSLRSAAGSLLVVGLGGTELTAMERAWLKLMRPAGIILFRRNIDECGADARAAGRGDGILRAALRAICRRGGRNGGPAARCAGADSAGAGGGAGCANATGRSAAGARARRVDCAGGKGVRIQFIAGAGVRSGLPESQKVMGTRCAGSTAAEVVAYAREFLAGLAAQGVAGCGKHFPGLGGGTLDSHLETPKIRRTWQQLWQEDLEPYRALRDELPMVMVSHAAYPLTKEKKRPASVSSFWVGEVLRKRIGYRGIVLSDDLEMGGVAKFMPMGEAASGGGAHGLRSVADLPSC